MVAKGNQGTVAEAECKLGMVVLVVMLFLEEKAPPEEHGLEAVRKVMARMAKGEWPEC